MLLGREEERLALDRLLAEARDGHSGVLALVGEPGIGKTALLAYAAGRADGMQILRARGVETEAEVPFAGLSELLGPALAVFDRIPGPQATALAGALALGPPAAQDRFAIGAATLSLLSAYAEEAPLALLVDDAHLLDPSTADALLFAARRLVADPIALVLAVRDGSARCWTARTCGSLRVPGLSRSEATELLEGASAPTGVIDRLYRDTGGNPLALLELAADAEGVAVLPTEVPVPISSRIASAFLHRFGLLEESTRRVLVLVAAGQVGDLALLARAASALGADIELLGAAEEAGLVRLASGSVEFVHPLARSAVYADASPRDRRDAHAALASVLPDRDVDRRAWHLAAASIGPSREASGALEQAAGRARERSAYAVAAAAFERAARLAPGEDERERLLVEAAESAWLAGDALRTLALLDEVPREDAPPALGARLDHMRGQVALRRGPVMDGYPLMVRAAEAIAESDPESAVVILAEAVHGGFYAGDTRAMRAAAERAAALAGPLESRRAAFFSAMARGMALVASGEGEAGMAAARRAVAILEQSDELRDDPRLLAWAALGPLWLREADAGRGLIDRASERARHESALGFLPYLLHHIARDQATTDRWPAAEASYDEAIRLAIETGQRADLAAALAGLAWLAARQGEEEVCRRRAREAREVCDELGIGLYRVWTFQAVGDLELGLGRPAEAIPHYIQQVEAMRSLDIADVDLSPAPELVEAQLRLGSREEAAAAAEGYVAAAQAKGQPWALARAARCVGLLADEEWEASFERALVLHARTPDAFEAARTRLAYGARLRRARQRVRAREQLRTAHAVFGRLGARGWSDLASAELAATGETARRRDATPSTS